MSGVLQVGHWSDSGPREQNQDSCGAFFGPSPAGEVVLAYVADGMGGMEAGEEASAAAGRVVARAARGAVGELSGPAAQAAFMLELTRVAND